MPSPRENPALWDYVVIGSVVFPPDGVRGHARVKAPIEYETDTKGAKGKNGGRTTLQGRKAGTEVDIEIVWNDEPGAYDLVREAIDTLTDKGAGPYGIAHGSTDFAAVKDVTLVKVTSPEWADGKGSITIQAKRWDAPAVVLGAGGAAGSGVPASLLAQIAQAEAELAALTSTNFQDETAVLLARSKVASLKAIAGTYATSATKTPTSSDPTKQYAQGGSGGPTTLPLGEIQPPQVS